jgi:hypothetical protein
MDNKLNAVILDGYTENPGDLNWDYLESVFNLTVYDRTPKELVIERSKNADVLIVNKVAITKDILNELPKLKFVATLATGFNQLDTVALRERNIPVSNIPFENINQGTIAVESSRAVAEAQGKLIIAKRFPRDEVQAYAKAIQACQRPQMANTAFYSFPRGKGNVVSGVSIRFAEELARCWGNIDYGIKELSRDSGKSEMQAYAWDMETNTISTQNFTNPHIREAGKQQITLTSQRDIYEANANMGARRLRSRILAILPADFVEAAIEECKRTLAGGNEEPLIDRVKKMVVSFAKFGVSAEQIAKRLGRKVETMTIDDFVEYVGIYNALKEGASKVSDWFECAPEANEITAAVNAAIEGGNDNGKS